MIFNCFCMFQNFHAIFFVWNIGLRVRAQINVGASIVVKVRLHLSSDLFMPSIFFYAPHLGMTPKCTCRIGTYLSSLLYFCVWYGHCSLQESMILPESEKHCQCTSNAVPRFFLQIGTVFATSLPLACFWDKNWIFFRMIQMIWELSRWYRISAEGLQSVQYISGKFQRWNLSLPSLPAGV